ncbi:MAG TPA: DUF72 domain-containing protein [Vicinamibacteria bacterium]|nr:DUF72 domain-containing protein [Vicinamibacteria bacterium]
MRLLAGTSGFAYKEWKGSFYPSGLKDAQMLPFYASRFPAVEINNTFYRMPARELLDKWAAETPPDFTFVLKAPQRITHQGRLRNEGDPLGKFLQTAEAMGARLGPLLFQLPPFFKKDLERLRAFLALLPGDRRAAFEFRHESWADEEVHAALRERGAALCVADTDEDEQPAPIVATASWGYLRLRRTAYPGDMLRAWAARIRAQPWSEVFVFFKHEEKGTGPALAREFMEVWPAP